jgi:hypothetical protein
LGKEKNLSGDSTTRARSRDENVWKLMNSSWFEETISYNSSIRHSNSDFITASPPEVAVLCPPFTSAKPYAPAAEIAHSDREGAEPRLTSGGKARETLLFAFGQLLVT